MEFQLVSDGNMGNRFSMGIWTQMGGLSDFVWEPIFVFVWEPIFDFVWEPISYGILTGNGGDMGLWGKDLDLEFRFDLEADFRLELFHIP